MAEKKSTQRNNNERNTNERNTNDSTSAFGGAALPWGSLPGADQLRGAIDAQLEGVSALMGAVGGKAFEAGQHGVGLAGQTIDEVARLSKESLAWQLEVSAQVQKTWLDMSRRSMQAWHGTHG